MHGMVWYAHGLALTHNSATVMTIFQFNIQPTAGLETPIRTELARAWSQGGRILRQWMASIQHEEALTTAASLRCPRTVAVSSLRDEVT